MKRYKYLEIKSGTNIHPGIALAQGIQILDIASKIATDQNDIDRMVKISMKWLTVGERLAAIMDEDDEETEEELEDDGSEEKPEFGFGLGKQALKRKEGEDDAAGN